MSKSIQSPHQHQGNNLKAPGKYAAPNSASTLIPRAFSRTAFEAPVKYAVSNSDQFRCTRMVNYSEVGLCYEVDQQLDPETDVTLLMDDYAPGQIGPAAYRSYLTRIRWIRPLYASENCRYAAGAQIITRSHEALNAYAEELRHTCDLCGKTMQINQLQCTTGNASLCEQCFKHFQYIPPGKVRQCVERFLVGNVV